MSKISKKQGIIIGAVVAVLLIGLGIWFFLVPPSAEAVCEKMSEIAGEEINEEDLGGTFVEACTEAYEEAEDDDGYLTTLGFRKCVMRSDDGEDVSDCIDEYYEEEE